MMIKIITGKLKLLTGFPKIDGVLAALKKLGIITYSVCKIQKKYRTIKKSFVLSNLATVDF